MIIHSIIQFLKDIDWKIINIDITKLLARSLYIRYFILTVILDFVLLKDVIIQLFNNFSLAKLTALSFPSVLLILLTLYQLPIVIKNLYYIAKNKSFKNNAINDSVRATAVSGVPGAGKTTSTFYRAVILSKKLWLKLRIKYYYVCTIPKVLLSKNLKAHRNEIIEAYNFYTNSPFVPCLWSMTSIQVGKRFAHKLTNDQLLQKKIMVYGSVYVVDEIGSLFPNFTGKQKKILEPLSDLCRYIRHYIDSYFFFTEQEFSKAFIDIRRCTGSVQYLTKIQKWVLKPKFLIALFNLLFSDVYWQFFKQSFLIRYSKSFYKTYRKIYSSSKHFAWFFKWLDRYISEVGFRRYEYKELGNQEVDLNNSNTKSNIFYLESRLNFKYDDRCFKNKYRCKNQKYSSVLQGFNSLVMTEEELDQYNLIDCEDD